MNIFKQILGHPGGGDIVRQVEGEDLCQMDDRDSNYQLEDLRVKTTIEWPDGSSTTKILNWSNRDAVRGFARVARSALVNGGKVITERVDG